MTKADKGLLFSSILIIGYAAMSDSFFIRMICTLLLGVFIMLMEEKK